MLPQKRRLGCLCEPCCPPNARVKATWVLWATQKRTRYSLDKDSTFYRALQIHSPQGRAKATTLQSTTANGVDMDEDMKLQNALASCPRTLADGNMIMYTPYARTHALTHTHTHTHNKHTHTHAITYPDSSHWQPRH